MSSPTDISAAEARQRLSELLDAVATGEEIRILRHGKPIARLVPVEAPGKPLPSLSSFRKQIRVTGEPGSQTVIRGRREER